jgi:hypothetical protein
MRKSLEQRVWRRARDACEYCQIPQALYRSPFQIDHIIARQHGGRTLSTNLALSCYHCNLHKGPNIAGIDPVSGELTRLFHPRRDTWSRHFEWDGPELMGRTAIGRTTIAVLAINDPVYVAVRVALINEGAFGRTSK